MRLKVSSIDIGGRSYGIEFMDVYSVSGENGLAGDINYHSGEIRIATKQMNGGNKHVESIEHTVWHEFLHAIDYSYGMEHSEDDINRLGEGLIQIFKQLGTTLLIGKEGL